MKEHLHIICLQSERQDLSFKKDLYYITLFILNIYIRE